MHFLILTSCVVQFFLSIFICRFLYSLIHEFILLRSPISLYIRSHTACYRRSLECLAPACPSASKSLTPKGALGCYGGAASGDALTPAPFRVPVIAVGQYNRWRLASSGSRFMISSYANLCDAVAVYR